MLYPNNRMKQEKPSPILDPQVVEKKLRIAEELFMFAYEQKRFQLRKKFPELSEREINHKAYKLIEKGCT